MTTSPRHQGNTATRVMTGFTLYSLMTPLHAHSDILYHLHLSADTVLYHFGTGFWLGILAPAGLAALYYLQRKYLQKKHPHKQLTDPATSSPLQRGRD